MAFKEKKKQNERNDKRKNNLLISICPIDATEDYLENIKEFQT